MLRQYELVDLVTSYDPDADEDALNRAYVFAMKKHGAQKAMMSGSGPSVFGIFTDEKKASALCDELIKNGANAKVCVPITK